ncbi:Crp/Fnr family transcriptional regulator [Hyphomicrobium sulfonivorans]|nr:cyclic nucleotide-binding domain-containing protein [Hyphomicrobium sulfonivorans]
MPLRQFAANSPVFCRNDASTAMYIVCSGTVEITDGATRQFQIGPGEIFGELALMEESHRKESATACTATEVAVVDRAMFLKLIATEPELALQIMQAIAERVRSGFA